MTPKTRQDYLGAVEPAARALHALTWQQHAITVGLEAAIVNLQQAVATFAREADQGYRQADALVRDAYISDDMATHPGAVAWQREVTPDDVMMAAGIAYETYFGADRRRFEASQELEDTSARVGPHAHSQRTAAGALLQAAKEGISLIHNGLASCPAGRQVGSQALREVIWQGRNQAAHWSEGKFTPAVVRCFDALVRDFGPQSPRLARYAGKENCALEVLEILDWRDYARFEGDLLQLA